MVDMFKFLDRAARGIVGVQAARAEDRKQMREAAREKAREETRAMARAPGALGQRIAGVLGRGTRLAGGGLELGRIGKREIDPFTGKERVVKERLGAGDISGLAGIAKIPGAQLAPELAASKLVRREEGGLGFQTGTKEVIDSITGKLKEVPQIIDIEQFKQTQKTFETISGMGKNVKGLGKAEKATENIAKTKPSGWKAAGGMFKSLLGVTASGPLGILQVVIKLIQKWLEITGIIEPLNMLMELFTSTLQGALSPALGEVIEVLMSPEIITAIQTMAGAFAAVLIPTMQVFAQFVQMLINSGVFDAITQFFTFLGDIFTEIAPIVTEISGIFFSMIGTFIEIFLSIFEVVPWTDIISLVGAFVSVILTVIESIPWDTIIDFVTLFVGAIANIFAAIPWDQIVTAVGNFITWIGSIVSAIPWGTINTVLVAVVDGFRVFVNGILGVWNAFAGAVNAADVLDLFPNLPVAALLAEGGLITGPTFAMLGEKGPEFVIPLDRASEFGGGGGTVVNITGFIGDAQVRELDYHLRVRDAMRFV